LLTYVSVFQKLVKFAKIMLRLKNSEVSILGNKNMESSVIELLKPVTLEKENCHPIIFEAGTVLKVVMQTPTSLLVSNDDDFNFTIPLKDENDVWREL